MKIVSFKPGHDGVVAAIEDGRLIFSFEAEHDSFPRYNSITPRTFLNAIANLDSIPDIVAVSGWVKGFYASESPMEAGYFGHDQTAIKVDKIRFLGKQIDYFTSSHERSHLLCGYGMSPFEQEQACYVLLWEGTIGSFYEIDKNLNVHKLAKIMDDPGDKYSFVFALADPTYPLMKGYFRFSDAGKLMALAAYSNHKPMTKAEKKTAEFILDRYHLRKIMKTDMQWSPFFNIGLSSSEFRNFTGKFSDLLFDRFYSFAKQNMRKQLPLLIVGGCGLNCYWNTKWKNSGLFPDVFIPPCTNDTGSAIGTAIDAQFYFTGNAKLNWDVYAGEEFEEDVGNVEGFDVSPLDYKQVVNYLLQQKVIAWVQGRCEIGPRALGNRSLLASPFESNMKHRLNEIKQREDYRPIAPVCLEDDVSKYFDWNEQSPYMLHFQKLKTDKLKAVTHVDNSARVQTVNYKQNKKLYHLLKEFKKKTGFSVLCNTSLNFEGKGFINRTSDLIRYCLERKLDGFVIHDRLFIKK